ncbi:MAG: hypothetical protein ABJM06_07860 [Gilvibacter sp.]
MELLKITGYKDKEFRTPLSGEPYTVMINPETIKWQRSIEYSNKQPPDSSTASQKYTNTPSDKLNFDIIIDCTGVVDEKRVNMADEIDRLENIIFTYQGDIHRPAFVKIQWGKDITFKSVLKSFDTTYTLFKPDGSPLRAKVSLSFGEYVSPKVAKKEEAAQSPDMTHLVEVVQGDTLPGLCQKVWNDPNYYIQLARYNDLNKFRNLRGVSSLLFPPIIQPE